MTIIIGIVAWMLIGSLSANRWSKRVQAALNIKYPTVSDPIETEWGFIAFGAFLGLFALLASLTVRPRLWGNLKL